ncbi:MAG TPA: hypothetical protein VGV63_09230 [Acidimicrobiales bacterium]|nr:hypothetical protein [Acidimicrobiales bacterium]
MVDVEAEPAVLIDDGPVVGGQQLALVPEHGAIRTAEAHGLVRSAVASTV